MTERIMKDSKIEWIGDVPNNWKIIKAKYLFKERNEKGNKIELQLLSPTQYYRVIPQKLFQELSTSNPVQISENADLMSFKTVHKGDFCISLSAYMGGFEYSEYEGVISPAYHSFYKTNMNVVNDYYKYLFKSNRFIDLINTITPQSVRVGRNTSFFDFGNSYIPLPPEKEQTRIANYLDSKCSEIDNLTKDIEYQIQTLEEYKKSTIIEAVTKGLNPDVQMKDSDVEWIGYIPNTWRTKKVKYISKISRGIFSHRPRNDQRYYDGVYPFIQTGDVACNKKYISEYTQTLNELGITVSKKFKKGTIAMTIAANVGDVSILDFDAYFPDSIIALIPLKNTYNDYLYYLLVSMKEEFTRLAVVNTQLNLNVERVGNAYVPYTPNIEEQQEIADYLDTKCSEIDSIISDKKKQLETLAEYKKSLIYEYVTGKKRLHNGRT